MEQLGEGDGEEEWADLQLESPFNHVDLVSALVDEKGVLQGDEEGLDRREETVDRPLTSTAHLDGGFWFLISK